jgi:uroporphyrinogen decarboxylase
MQQLSSWERVKLAIEHKDTDRVPTNFYGVPEIHQRLVADLKKDDMEQVLEHLGIDVREVGARFVGPRDLAGGFDVREADTDIWGVVRKPVHNPFGVYTDIVHHPLAAAQSIDDVEKHPWPKVEWFDVSHLRAEIKQLNRQEKRWIKCFGGGAFETPWYMRGLDQFLIDLIENPELAEAISRHAVDFFIARTRKIFEACDGQLDMILTGGDIGTQRGMMLAPDLWRKHIKPYSHKLFKTYAEWGVKLIYHSCGSIRPVIPDFIEMGLDVLDPVQPLAVGMDPVSLKQEFGRQLTFHGGIDEQHLLPHGTSQEVFAQTQALIRVLSQDGGYILAPAHAFQADTPTANILAMYRAAGSVRVD